MQGTVTLNQLIGITYWNACLTQHSWAVATFFEVFGETQLWDCNAKILSLSTSSPRCKQWPGSSTRHKHLPAAIDPRPQDVTQKWETIQLSDQQARNRKGARWVCSETQVTAGSHSKGVRNEGNWEAGTTKLEHVDRHSMENAKAREKLPTCSGLEPSKEARCTHNMKALQNAYPQTKQQLVSPRRKKKTGNQKSPC